MKNGQVSGLDSLKNRLVVCANCGLRWTDSPNGICRVCLKRIDLQFGLGR